jgi:hypothetical protein
MRQQRSRACGAGAFVALTMVLALVVPTSLPATAGARTDAVVEWNEHAVNALVVTGLQPPGVAGLHLAMVHGAVYDAVNAIDDGFEEYLVEPPAKGTYSKDAAAGQAAHDVLVQLLPAQEATLDGLLGDTLARIPDGAAETGGVAVGKAAAKAMIDERTGDGRFGAPGFPIGDEPGEWRPTLPLFANDPAGWLRDVDPFLIRRASQFRTAGPNELTSDEYAVEIRRGEGGRVAQRLDAHGRADRHREVLGRSRRCHVEPHPPADLGHPGSDDRRERPPLRDGLPDRRRRDHRLLGRQGVLELLAPDHCDP